MTVITLILIILTLFERDTVKVEIVVITTTTRLDRKDVIKKFLILIVLTIVRNIAKPIATEGYI